ncbi:MULTISPECIES: anhydro-N-acetylmuramic acid kinase [Methylomonas]|uniref:anhydro-N-acetylmuramic acid kinase n=1 Tax=Methylomonas TaxID=416 RepID=UPI001E4C1840|nr:anhydro-N-acetylmuramic acid kinase [Methylomonas rhizoryzae]
MPATKRSELYIGLISGTSIDGVDAGLVDFSSGIPRLLASFYQPFTVQLQQQLHRFCQPNGSVSLQEYGTLDAQLGELFGQAALALLDKADVAAGAVAAIGSHGQTIYHAPDGEYGFTLQIGDPNRVAQITGITTVADFRRRDIAAGGQGAPLVPAFHSAMFAKPDQTITVLNIGGIANLSILRPDGVIGFDTGPGNTLMDYWCRKHQGQAFDAGGQWGAQGGVDSRLLQHLLDDPYFDLAPPKSTGPEYFSGDWLQTKIAAFSNLKPEHVQATLCKLTAASISRAIVEYAPASAYILLCGGGVHNPLLVSMLTEQLAMPVVSTAEFGVDPDYVEAMTFAWLARQTLHGLPGNLCSVTGAAAPTVLGGIYPAFPAS